MKIIVDWEQNYQSSTSDALLQEVTDSLYQKGIVESASKTLAAINQRRQIGDTLVAANVAVPHIQSSTVKQAIILFVKLSAGLSDYQPGYQVDRFVFILLPQAAAKDDLQYFKRLFIQLADETVMNILSHGDYVSVANLLQLKGE